MSCQELREVARANGLEETDRNEQTLADAIDIPFVFGVGVAVLGPLVTFEILTGASILRAMWHQRLGDPR